MDENKKNIPGGELNDETLDAVAGGIIRRSRERTEPCRRCEKPFPASDLLGGYCGSCLDELHKMGVYPPI